MKTFIAYYRVSTKAQGESGLGLEAQQAAVTSHILSQGGQLAASYREVESGKVDQRGELLKAIAHAKRAKATLIVAKLDRLSRNAAFLLTLQESQLPLVFCDLPGANEFTIGIMALVAQNERKMISQRTKDALKAYKARGGLLGGARPGAHKLTAAEWAKGQRSGAIAMAQRAAAAYSDIKPMMQEMRANGETFAAIATKLTVMGHKTRNDKAWSATQVYRVLSA